MNFTLFEQPPKGYGEVAFFWWHGNPITREKLTWILDQLEDHHISGLQINYCHSDRGGRSWGLTMESEPAPFTEDWWVLVEWFQQEASRRGMAISLSDYTLSSPGQESFTDEVLRVHPEFTGQVLRLVPEGGNLSKDYYDCQILGYAQGGEIVRARMVYSLNPMHPGTGEAIADAFYGAFEKRMPGSCGTGLNYFFSDELNFNVRGMLWCDDFEAEFTRRKGYDLLPHLAELFDDDAPTAVKTRLDYYDVVMQLSEERFFKPVYNWHEERGMIFGCDHGGRGYDVTEFGDYFRAMRWYQGPGNDQPRLGSDIVRSKVSSSVAHLYQRPRTWLEGFYSSGWQTSSADLADAIFRNYALGHNLLSLHGLYYSTHGSHWEWAPPCNHHHMPYWLEMESLLGATERLSWLMCQGTHCCDVAIVYPVAAVEVDPETGKQAVDCAFQAANHLYAHGVDFDFIDFESIERAKSRDGRLCVSGEEYRTVILPDMQAVRFGMMEKLAEFAREGGRVAIIGHAPVASDRIGREDPLLDRCIADILQGREPYASVEPFFADAYRPEEADFLLPEGVQEPYFQHRRLGNEDLYLIYRVPEGAKCGFRASGRPVLLDPFTGKRYAVTDYTFDGTHTFLPMVTRFAGLMLLLFTQDVKDIAPLYTGPCQEIPFAGQWHSTLEPTLDNTYGDYRLPVAQTMLGAEARDFDYRFDGDGAWAHATHSYAPYLYVHRGEADEAALSQFDLPDDSFTPYSFSMRSGVEGDAGYQGSFHGLKGCISDDFIALGEKKLTYAGSSSEYVGEGPFYLLGWVRLDKKETLRMDCGAMTPAAIWVDHQPVPLGEVTLETGLHTILLKYATAGRTHFLLMRDVHHDFVQTMPLAMRWYGHPDVVPFLPQPWHEGKPCEFRFIAPPGTEAVVLPAALDCTIEDPQASWRLDGCRLIPDHPLESSREIILREQGESAILGPALMHEPIQFIVGEGLMDVSCPIEEQGLKHYSGGIRYRKTIPVADVCAPVMLRLGAIDCAAQVWVNGQHAGTLVAPPYDLDVTAFLCGGDNEFEILIHNTLRNHMRTIPTNFLFDK